MACGSVVVVTHNSADCIESCLRSVICRNWEVIVVDNASTDGTLSILRNFAPDISVLLNERNAGFAMAVNQGCKIATGPLVLILNPDVVARPNALDEIAGVLSMEGIAAASGLLTDSTGRPQVGFTFRRLPGLLTALAEILLLNRLWPYNSINRRYRCLTVDHSKTQDVEQPAGACLAFRREVWADLGGFDEDFFPIWFEDVDFCKRLRDRNIGIRFCPNAVFVHQGAHSIGRLNFRARQSFWYRNLLLYFAKHHSRLESVILRSGLLAGLALRGLLSVFGLHAKGVSVRESLSAFWHVAWQYAICARYSRPNKTLKTVSSPVLQ